MSKRTQAIIAAFAAVIAVCMMLFGCISPKVVFNENHYDAKDAPPMPKDAPAIRPQAFRSSAAKLDVEPLITRMVRVVETATNTAPYNAVAAEFSYDLKTWTEFGRKTQEDNAAFVIAEFGACRTNVFTLTARATVNVRGVGYHD